MDKGYIKDGYEQITLHDDVRFTGWSNQRLVPELNDSIILEHIQKIQRSQQIAPSKQLEGHYNLTVEMETGVGKTYTYIKTMFELNKRYGWSKFIVVVPSVAIREGVYKSFQITQDHFAEEYGKKIRYFIYNSAQLTEIDRFASDSAINVMIINSQAFNATGKEVEALLGQANITVNKNTIPFEMQSPFVTSGIRIGTPAVTTRGLKEAEFTKIGGLIARIVKEKEAAVDEVKAEVLKLCAEFPLYK
jgi:restriction endonuclease